MLFPSGRHRATLGTPGVFIYRGSPIVVERLLESRPGQKRCERDAAWRVIVQADVPDFRTISNFRKLHLKELEGLFVQVLWLCQEAGLVKLG
jgi:transposase